MSYFATNIDRRLTGAYARWWSRLKRGLTQATSEAVAPQNFDPKQGELMIPHPQTMNKMRCFAGTTRFKAAKRKRRSLCLKPSLDTQQMRIDLILGQNRVGNIPQADLVECRSFG